MFWLLVRLTVVAAILCLSGCVATYEPEPYWDGGYVGSDWYGTIDIDGHYRHDHDFDHYHPDAFRIGERHDGGWGSQRGRASLGPRIGAPRNFGGHPAGGARGGVAHHDGRR